MKVRNTFVMCSFPSARSVCVNGAQLCSFRCNACSQHQMDLCLINTEIIEWGENAEKLNVSIFFKPVLVHFICSVVLIVSANKCSSCHDRNRNLPSKSYRFLCKDKAFCLFYISFQFKKMRAVLCKKLKVWKGKVFFWKKQLQDLHGARWHAHL